MSDEPRRQLELCVISPMNPKPIHPVFIWLIAAFVPTGAYSKKSSATVR